MKEVLWNHYKKTLTDGFILKLPLIGPGDSRSPCFMNFILKRVETPKENRWYLFMEVLAEAPRPSIAGILILENIGLYYLIKEAVEKALPMPQSSIIPHGI